MSKRAAGAIGLVAILLLLAFAYGGYKRSKTAQAKADRTGIPNALAPATAAGSEFTKAIPAGNAAVGQLKAPEEARSKGDVGASACGSDPQTGKPYRFNSSTGAPCNRRESACGVDPRTGQRDRYDPLTGHPCDGQAGSVERLAIRRAPPSAVQASQQPNSKEIRLQDLYKHEQEAMQAPTSVHLANASSINSASGSSNPTSQNDLAQVAALGAALSGSRRH